jgi:hypothetical protein
MTTVIKLNKIQLSNKIRINKGNGAELLRRSELFYSKYSRFTLKALKKYRYQHFLSLMLEREAIDKNNVDSVRVEVYPVRKKAGSSIAGRCNPITGKICIYPKTKHFCNFFEEKYGRILLVAYVKNRARASLIHELLHIKYYGDEEKVRALTQTYFSTYLRLNENANVSTYDLIFGPKNVLLKEMRDIQKGIPV